MTKPKYKDTEESEAADKCKNDKNAVTNLDFLFQRKDTESEFVDTVRNDDITADVYDCNNDSIDDYEIAEQLLQKLLEGQKNLYDDSPLGFVHSKISQQEDSVNKEIIDMLIQWEETINQNTEADDTNSSSSSSSSNDDGDVTCSPSATVPMKMLQKLNLLDLTMEKIEDWLEWRIKEFSDVSEELTSIENERKHLDVTTKNLSILKRDMTHLIEENCLTDEEEKVIQAAPDLIINSLSGSFVDIKSQLKPLTAALEKLHFIRCAHNQQKKGDENDNYHEIALKSLSGVSFMQQHLARVSVDYLRRMEQIFSMSIFTTALNHRDLLLSHTYRMKSLPLQEIVAIDALISCSTANTDPEGINEKNSLRSINPLQITQLAIHDVIADISALVQISMKISPPLADRMQRDYIHSVREKYKHLLRQLLKEIQDSCKYEGKVLTMSTVASYVLGTFGGSGISFITCVENSIITPWTQLELFLTLTLPFIERECIFFESIFSVDLDSVSSDEGCSGYESYAEYLFSGVMKGVRILIEEAVDGVASVGQYSVLDKFCTLHKISIEQETKSNNQCKCHEKYQCKVLHRCRSLIVKRVESLLSNQLQWLQSQRANPKQAIVTIPFMKFPTLVDHYLQVFTSDIENSYTDQFYKRLIVGLINWLETNVVRQNQKYADVLRITNYSFLLGAFGELRLKQVIPPSIDASLQSVRESLDVSRIQYVKWMVAYEFPILTSIHDRFSDLICSGSNLATLPNLALFASKNEIASLGISEGELTKKSIQTKLKSIRKRFEKHFDVTMKLTELDDEYSCLWRMIKERFLEILQRIHEGSLVSFQLSFQNSIEAAFGSFA